MCYTAACRIEEVFLGGLPVWAAVSVWTALLLAAGCCAWLGIRSVGGQQPTDQKRNIEIVEIVMKAEPVTALTVELGAVLRRLRTLRELTVAEVCRRWNSTQPTRLSPTRLMMYESGTQCPSVQVFCILCALFGVFPPNALASVDEVTVELPNVNGS